MRLFFELVSDYPGIDDSALVALGLASGSKIGTTIPGYRAKEWTWTPVGSRRDTSERRGYYTERHNGQHCGYCVLVVAVPALIAALAVYRVSFMIAREDGPFDVFERLRLLAITRYPPETTGNRTRPHWIVRGISCPLCISWWLALPAALIVAPDVSALGLWPAIAGLCLFLYQLGGA